MHTAAVPCRYEENHNSHRRGRTKEVAGDVQKKRKRGCLLSENSQSKSHRLSQNSEESPNCVRKTWIFSLLRAHTSLFFGFFPSPKFPRTIPLHYRKSGKQKENFLLFISLVCLTNFFLLSKSLPSLVSLSFKQLYSAVIDANKLKAQVNGEKCSSAV